MALVVLASRASGYWYVTKGGGRTHNLAEAQRFETQEDVNEALEGMWNVGIMICPEGEADWFFNSLKERHDERKAALKKARLAKKALYG